MKWTTKIGNVPVLHSYYLVGDIGNNVLNNGLSFNTYPYIDNIGEYTIFQRGLKMHPTQLSQDDVFLNIPVYSTENASLNTELNYVINKRGESIADLYTEENSTLGIGHNATTIYAYSEEANRLVYVFAIALYGGDGNVLKGYWICGAIGNSEGHLDYMPASTSNNTVINLQVLHQLDYDIPLGEESAEFGPASEDNGYGKQGKEDQVTHIKYPGGTPSFDFKSDKIGVPAVPSIGCTTAGFYHAYKVSQGTLNDLGAKLFPTLGNLIGEIAPFSSVEEALAYMTGLIISPGIVQGTTVINQNLSLLDVLMNGKSIDYVVDCHVIPVSPTVGGSQNIKCGARTLDISAPVITSDYIDYDCGSVSVPLTFTNFLDFTSCRCRLFLPFVGFVDLKPEFWHGGTIFVKYRFNIVDGSFMAYVICMSSAVSVLNQTVIGQFGGAACMHIPVTGVNYASMISGMVSGSMSLAAGTATGNAVGAVGGALTLTNMQPGVASSNNYNSSTAFLGVRRPYMMIERPIPSMSTKYAHSKGLPLNVALPIGSVHGYTEIEDVDLSGLDYTQEEIEELRSLLAGGVYL